MNATRFQIVCANCGCIGVQLDFPDDAPSSTEVSCATCGNPRGTLYDLRSLASPNQDSLLDVTPKQTPSRGKQRRKLPPRRASNKGKKT